LLELRHEARVSAEREVGLNPLFERGEPGVLEPRAGVSGERLGMELDERRAAPQLERLVEPLRRSLPIAGAELLVREGRELLGAGDWKAAAKRFDEALELWRGSPFVEFHAEPFARDAGARL